MEIGNGVVSASSIQKHRLRLVTTVEHQVTDFPRVLDRVGNSEGDTAVPPPGPIPPLTDG